MRRNRSTGNLIDPLVEPERFTRACLFIQKLKKNELLAGMEVELTGTEDNSSEALNRNTPSIAERVTTSNQHLLLINSRKDYPEAALITQKIQYWERRKIQSEQDQHSETLKNLSWDWFL